MSATLVTIGSAAVTAAFALLARDRAERQAIRHFSDARATPHAAAIVGDGAERVHLVVPVAAVACDRRTLERLAAIVGRRTGTARRAVRLEFALAPIGSGLAGPDGAVVRDGVWLAPSLARRGGDRRGPRGARGRRAARLALAPGDELRPASRAGERVLARGAEHGEVRHLPA